MRPTQLKPGQKVLLRPGCGTCELAATFVRRVPRDCGRAEFNVFTVPDYAGQLGIDDDGKCTMSDYDVGQQVRPAP